MSFDVTACPYHLDTKPSAYSPDKLAPYFCVYCCVIWRNERNRLEEIERLAHYKACMKRMKDYTKRVKQGGRLTQEEYGELIAWAKRGIEHG